MTLLKVIYQYYSFAFAQILLKTREFRLTHTLKKVNFALVNLLLLYQLDQLICFIKNFRNHFDTFYWCD